jgi:hypothetical protein
MKLIEWLFTGNKQVEEERRCLEDIGMKLQIKLGQPFTYKSMRRTCLSKDEIIGITPSDRHLYSPSRMKKVKKEELLFEKNTVGDARNIFSRRHFEGVGEALNWECEIFLSEKGNAPALFKFGKANIWVAPIIVNK